MKSTKLMSNLSLTKVMTLFVLSVLPEYKVAMLLLSDPVWNFNFVKMKNPFMYMYTGIYEMEIIKI